MNHSTLIERNDTGILSLADLFRRDRLPCRAEPKRWLSPDPASRPVSGENPQARVAPEARPSA